MKRLLSIFLIGLITISCKTIKIGQSKPDGNLKVYTDFLGKENTSAKDYIFGLFKKYDIVILCERDHNEITQYELILDILRDKRFSKIKNAYFENGNSYYNNELNKILSNGEISIPQAINEITNIQRNIFPVLWEKTNYYYYLTEVFKFNKSLPTEKKINIHNLDFGLNWQSATEKEIDSLTSLVPQRDSVMAENFFTRYNASNSKKALVVLNFRHAFLKDFVRKNTGYYISYKYKNKVANVLLNSIIITSRKVADISVPITAISSPQKGKWEASFLVANKDNLGFNLNGSPFGRDGFDLVPIENDYTYSDVFTGFVYYKHMRDFEQSISYQGFIDEGFYDELLRRY